MVDILKKNKKIILIIWLCILLAITILLASNNHKQLKVIKQVELTSGRRSYANKEEGAWNLTKTAKWIAFRKAQIEFNFDSIAKNSVDYYQLTTAQEIIRNHDILLVIDTSDNVDEDKIINVKNAVKDLIEYKLSKFIDNRFGIITLNNNSEIISNFTGDFNELSDKIDTLNFGGPSNYYQSLMNVENVLNNYDADYVGGFTVLFITGGYSNKDTPMEVGEYFILKDKYPFIKIKAIQYDLGDDVLEMIAKISDIQYVANDSNLLDVLKEASSNTDYFKNVEVIDYINDNFKVESVDDIKPSIGSVELENDNGKQKVIWTIPSDTLRTGQNANLTIDVTLQETSYDKEYVITNEKEEITVKLPEEESETQKTNIRPTLKNASKVIYNGNSPSDCVVTGVPNKEYYSPLEPVTIAEDAKCEGYNFKKWDINNDNLVMINKNTFLMPEEDVELTAKWGKLELSLTMNGEVVTENYAADYLKRKANKINITNYNDGDKGEMYTFSHEATEQTGALTDYRYIGSSPNNYVYFNCTDESDKSTCEVWRIIGVFDVERMDPNDSNKRITETRIKLVRGSELANTMKWDDRDNDWIGQGINEWNGSLINIYLNGTYYDSLSETARFQIENARYYLGGHDWHYGYGSAETLYLAERGTKRCRDSRSINWDGNIALMYPSDLSITYANGSWIHNTNTLENNTSNVVTWLLTPRSGDNDDNFVEKANGDLDYYYDSNYGGVRPVLYLKYNLKIIDGDGTKNSPYVLE